MATPAAFANGAQATLYFLQPPDRVMRIGLDGGGAKLVARVALSAESRARLSARRSDAGTSWSLILRRAGHESLVQPGFARALGGAAEASPARVAELAQALERSGSLAVDLRAEPERGARVINPPHSHHFSGIRVWPAEGGGPRRLAVVTPIERALVRSATVLPGDRIVFEYDGRLILGYHIPTRRLARLAEGQSPLVVDGPT